MANPLNILNGVRETWRADMSTEKTFTAQFERISKNFVVYKSTEGGVICNLYLPKHEMGVNPPKQLQVVVRGE